MSGIDGQDVVAKQSIQKLFLSIFIIEQIQHWSDEPKLFYHFYFFNSFYHFLSFFLNQFLSLFITFHIYHFLSYFYVFYHFYHFLSLLITFYYFSTLFRAPRRNFPDQRSPSTTYGFWSVLSQKISKSAMLVDIVMGCSSGRRCSPSVWEVPGLCCEGFWRDFRCHPIGCLSDRSISKV